MVKEIHNIVGGSVVTAKSGRSSPVFNPATGEQTGVVGLSDASDVAAAVAAAKAALPEWAATPPMRRARLMMNFRALLEENREELGKVIGAEHGKVLEDAMGEIQRGIENVEYACGIPQLLKGDFSRNVGPEIDSFSMRQPVGVCAGITPFNFPAMVPMWMYPNAIACGNTFILKPSERDPSASMFVHELFKRAGFPDGVLNIVHGDKAAVDALLTHPDVGAISFVGSTPIARYIYSTGAANGKRVQALGGAKNHMVVLPDADIDKAVDALVASGYGSAGERCMAIAVAVPVGDETADALIAGLKSRVENLRIGPCTDPDAEMGPLVTQVHRDRVSGYLDKGVAEGADLVVDGRGFSLQGYENGYFLGGSLFDRVTPDMTIYKEEIFGPVLSTVRMPDYESAVDLIHGHNYANGVAIFTRDGDAARNFADRIEVGMVGINVPIPVPVAYHSFGGWKESAFGSHAMYGPEGIMFWTRLKTVTERWPSGIKGQARLAFPSDT